MIDTVIGGFEVLRTAYSLSADDSDYQGPISRKADIAIGAGLTALFAASATYGYVVTGQCAELKDARRVQLPPPGSDY